MHRLYEKADMLSGKVIGAAIEVHRHKGPGLIESIYERCLLRELELRSIPATTQKIVRVEYKGLVFDEPLRFDLLVDDCLLVELKAVETLHPSSKAQLFSYMKLLDIPIGLLINFHEPVLKNGIFRMILPGANQPEGRRNFILGSPSHNLCFLGCLLCKIFCRGSAYAKAIAGQENQQKETKVTKVFQINYSLCFLRCPL